MMHALFCVRPSNKVDPFTVPIFDRRLIFPLMKLDPKATTLVLKYMNPFDQMSFSFISDETNALIRNLYGEDPGSKPIVNIKSYGETPQVSICNKFEPKVEWSFIFSSYVDLEYNAPDIETKNRIGHIYMLTWKSEKNVVVGEREEENKVEHSLIWYSLDAVWDTAVLCNYLRYIFVDAEVHINMDLGTPHKGNEHILNYAAAVKAEKYIYSMKKPNDSYLRKILETHAATKELQLLSEESMTKELPIEKLNVADKLFVGFAPFVKLWQIYHLKCKKVVLTLTNLKELHFIKLVDDLKAGWTPGWNSLFVDFTDGISLDSVIEQPIGEMKDPINLEEIDMSSPKISYQFKSAIKTRLLQFDAVGFHKVRKDGSILTVTVLRPQVAQIFIHPAGTNVLEVFSDPGDIWF
ncbi:hypothetical protein CAEBREN_16322 [Caenorhabditis brenneri]|uniref:F-box domain-containing protein n=1 Tax=Caenorhabditis brenneri TaxID=135651 RepID=G0NFC0_CAEBE|nr:hypothetical protein CAEBREN_16322 [Caenorhabditis brenneri]